MMRQLVRRTSWAVGARRFALVGLLVSLLLASVWCALRLNGWGWVANPYWLIPPAVIVAAVLARRGTTHGTRAALGVTMAASALMAVVTPANLPPIHPALASYLSSKFGGRPELAIVILLGWLLVASLIIWIFRGPLRDARSSPRHG